MSWPAVLLVALVVAVSPAPASFASPHRPALPSPDAGFDYQLGGAYRPRAGVGVVTRDRMAAPAPGAYNICYVNGFQTQPGRLGWWRHHHDRLLLRDSRGSLVHDPGWPGEVLLDVSSAPNRRHVAAVVGGWIRRCARDGFDAVEPDNLDSFSRSRSQLTRSDDLALAALLAQRAHRAGLAIAQKNVASLTLSDSSTKFVDPSTEGKGGKGKGREG